MAKKRDITVRKASGEQVPFDRDKLVHSLENAGAGRPVIERVLEIMEPQLYDGITTRRIYQLAYRLLTKMARANAGRYKLKQAIMELGPSGYAFEVFVGELLKNQGYNVQIGVTVQGKCVTHEIDVLATNQRHQYWVECKFHTTPGKKSNVIVPMYIHSRFRDIMDAHKGKHGHGRLKQESWVITNTRFTTDAIDYGKCAGMTLISWDYPKEGNLCQRINRSGLHPVTSLASLSRKHKKRLIEKDIVTVRALLDSMDLLPEWGVKKTDVNRIRREAQELISLDHTS